MFQLIKSPEYGNITEMIYIYIYIVIIDLQNGKKFRLLVQFCK